MDQAYLEGEVESLFREAVENRSGGLLCPLSLYSRQPPAIRYRLLQRMARELTAPGVSLPAQAILKADDLLRDRRPCCQLDLPKGITLKKEYVWLRLDKHNVY